MRDTSEGLNAACTGSLFSVQVSHSQPGSHWAESCFNKYEKLSPTDIAQTIMSSET